MIKPPACFSVPMLAIAMLALSLAAASIAAAPARAADDDDIQAANLALGEALFKERCAACHGADASGNGPAAGALKVPPPDLTQVTQRAGGKFPAARVVEIITYGGNIAAHGSGPMPVWGLVFSKEGGRGKIGAARSRQAIISLKRYLETIQK